jgi:RNA polymerase sigma-70 factor (ECF subfamily)
MHNVRNGEEPRYHQWLKLRAAKPNSISTVQRHGQPLLLGNDMSRINFGAGADQGVDKISPMYTGYSLCLFKFRMVSDQIDDPNSHLEERTSYLLERIARSSDEAAYRELFYTYYPSLFRFATTLLHEEQLAEEIVSDVFINIWKGRESLTSIRNLRVYLFVAVKNLCHRALSRAGAQPEMLEEEVMQSETGGGAMADGMLLSKELNQAFDLAVAALPERCRLIFRLVREEGLRYREIAIILNISQKTIEAQMTIATRRIVQAMGDLMHPGKRSSRFS